MCYDDVSSASVLHLPLADLYIYIHIHTYIQICRVHYTAGTVEFDSESLDVGFSGLKLLRFRGSSSVCNCSCHMARARACIKIPGFGDLLMFSRL